MAASGEFSVFIQGMVSFPRIISFLASLSILLIAASVPVAGITIDTVVVGNAGNAADSDGIGSVGYAYHIGTYEVTNNQYTAFLNAADAGEVGFTRAFPVVLYSPILSRSKVRSSSVCESAENWRKCRSSRLTIASKGCPA